MKLIKGGVIMDEFLTGKGPDGFEEGKITEEIKTHIGRQCVTICRA